VNINLRLQSAFQKTSGFLSQHGSTTTSISSLVLVSLPFDPTEYPQAPYQTLTKEQYNEWIQKMPIIHEINAASVTKDCKVEKDSDEVQNAF
jgi:hypothetical protein